MGKASKTKSEGARREKIAAQREAARRAERRRRLIMIGSITAAAVVVIGGIVGYVVSQGGSSSSSTSHEVIPQAITGGTPDVQPAAKVVANTSGISGVVAYDTTGWPTASNNGPAAQALRHTHVTGPVQYSVTPPVGGDHYPTPMTCGIYDKPVPNQYAVHDLEHGAVWITYQPSLPQSEVSQLRAFVENQTKVSPAGGVASRYMDLTPYPGLSSPIVISSWGFQLKVSSPTDARLQQFVNKFRASQTYTPEYGGPCTGGIGTPLQT